MDDLRVRLLGGLQVDGHLPNEVGSRKARTLLAALAVARAAPVAVETLADLLWGDDLPARPAEQVGVLVSRLRGVVGADRLVRHDAGYALVTSWLDVAAFEEGAAAAERAAGGGDALTARLAATVALDLVRGPLLPEEVAPWFDGPRAALERGVAATRLLAAEAALAAGDPVAAAALAARGLDHDPYDEAALRALMRAHIALGRPASALAAYATARARLSDDLGVSPTADTEAVHALALGAEPSPGTGVSPPAEQWDPLVQRARAELAATDLDSARRDAEEAVRRGGGAGALEVAGWVAYYHRDFGTALRWGEEAAATATEEERRASCHTLVGRIRHSRGDLDAAEEHLEAAVESAVPGVRAMGEVWLGSLRVHQGRPSDAIELCASGAVDAAVVRHPFVMPHALCARVHALGIQGRVADALRTLTDMDATFDDLGAVGARYRPAAHNFWAWILGSIGRTDEAAAHSRAAVAEAGRFSEPKHHALFDLAAAAIDQDDRPTAIAWLAQVDVPPDELGAMAWHQRHRLLLLEGWAALLDSDSTTAAARAEQVRSDAVRRGSPRPARLAEVLAHLAVVAHGDEPDAAAVDATLAGLDELARLEGWRLTARLAAATGRPELWAAADQRAAGLLERCGAEAPRTRGWIDAELRRLGRPAGAER